MATDEHGHEHEHGMEEGVSRFRLTVEAREGVEGVQPRLGEAAARVVFVAGPAVDVVLRLFGAAGVTLGRYVLVRRALLRRRVALALPARLVLHELAHVEQFAAEGAAPFLARYVASYLRGLRGLTARHRDHAYRAIPAEVLARQAEAGVAWTRDFPVEPV